MATIGGSAQGFTQAGPGEGQKVKRDIRIAFINLGPVPSRHAGHFVGNFWIFAEYFSRRHRRDV